MAFTVVQKLDKDPKDITLDYTLDTLGEPCPYPAICDARNHAPITERRNFRAIK